MEGLGLPGVRVIRQLNAGKPAALNRGLANARYDIVVMMDGDTVFEPSTVRELVQPFGDPKVGAVAGNAKVGNKDSLIGAWQHIEYVMGFNLDRRMYDVLGCMPTIPGAVGAFRRSALEPIGGMSDDTLAEDTDVTMALHRAGWRVVYAENARAWTEAPESVSQLWSQRYRWSYGTMQAIWKHRRAVIEKGPSGRFGRVGLPFVSLFMVVAPLLAPLIDVFLLYGLVFGPTDKTIVAWLGVLAIQAVCAAYAFRLDREKLTPLISLPLQQILYRQIMYVVLLQVLDHNLPPDHFVLSGIIWLFLMAVLGIGFLVTRKRNAKFAARLQAAGFVPMADEAGRVRYLPPGGQLPGHGNPFGAAPGGYGQPAGEYAPQPPQQQPYGGPPQAQQPYAPPQPYGRPQQQPYGQQPPQQPYAPQQAQQPYPPQAYPQQNPHWQPRPPQG
ncbi:hypothetical protein SVIOM342S_00299 [Streptomyces violaceorubidus]